MTKADAEALVDALIDATADAARLLAGDVRRVSGEVEQARARLIGALTEGK